MIACVTSQTLSALKAGAGGRLALIGAICASFATPTLAQANPCAIYGSGYVVVSGGQGCELIAERVRVDGSAAARSTSAPQGLANTALGYAPHQPAGPAPAHMRSPKAAQWPGESQNNPRTR